MKRGHEVHVLASHLKGLDVYSQADGVVFNPFALLSPKTFCRGFPCHEWLSFCRFFCQLVVDNALSVADHSCTFCCPAGFLAWILHKVTGLPYVLTTHLGDVPGGVPEKTDRWFRSIHRLGALASGRTPCLLPP